jgi:hypothetical protein
MKYILEEEYEYDFDLLGICCHEKDYRLCWALNNILNISLEKSNEDIEIIFNRSSKPNANFPLFTFQTENLLSTYFLIGNKCDYNWLIPEKQHVDFFLMIKSSEKIACQEISKKLQSIPFVLTAHTIVVDELKSKEHLIF